MKDKYIEACMNPIRQRILQVIIDLQEASSAMILEALSDVPRASMYRHIKVLLDAGVIEVSKEVSKRGSIEKYYKISSSSYVNGTNESMNKMIQIALLNLSSDFSKYLANPENDPVKDMLTVGSAVFLATDEEYEKFYSEYGKLLQKYIRNKPEAGRKTRKVTFISSPVE
jgi:DNA-binding transcriptional ArsR family regulator